ncbi:MAG: AGE family epimerase/isomerase [Pelosinus sp.]|nr:AGE family epimerase/isomerase [Pelosinus sp.]
MKFEFSDTVGGFCQSYDSAARTAIVKGFDGEEVQVKLSTNVYARLLRNLDEPYYDCTGQLEKLLRKDQLVFIYGIYYPDERGTTFEASYIDLPGRKPQEMRFEEADWWVNQARSIADFYIKAEFPNGKIEYDQYRTRLTLDGVRKKDFRQETDTISRMIYGMASAYMLTGEDRFLEVAETGTKYLREHMRFYDIDENVVYWYHGIDVQGEREHKLFTSEFDDDMEAIPMYEQIYALAGPTQTYRLNGDQAIMKDIRMTIRLFDKFFIDKEKGGYYSHIDPVTFDPKSPSLKHNCGKKNWNSVGDHAPAYLVNLYLATQDEKYKDFLEYTADCIEEHFKDYDHSPFVQERFFDDWSHDKSWGWQQDNAVIGHNLKIAWNLMRINSAVSKEKYTNLAKKIAELMPKYGMDVRRGGWYDVMARTLKEGETSHRFTWHDRKAWWQQEQGILAYQILYGVLKEPEYLELARISSAFYNTYFLDHDDGAVYFNVLNNGIPFLTGNERLKGSHSMSCYHSIELAFLSAVYINLLHTKKPLDLYFKPMVNGFNDDNILYVQPDILPKGSCKIEAVWIDGEPWNYFDAEMFAVKLPEFDHRPQIKVRIVPVTK